MTEHLPIARPGRFRRAPARGRRGRKPRHRYFAFLSYSHKDEELAEWLHSELEEFRVPSQLVGNITEHGVIPRRLTPVFRDRQELGAATDLGDEIEQALAGSQFLIVLCSPAAAASRWTNAEIASFKRNHPDGCVLAAIAEGEPFASEVAGRESEECFPPALRQRYDRLGRPTGRKAEPLAADLREGQGGRRVGFLKLVAGMLGVGLDELVQRETTRRQRRLAYLAAASLAGMTLTSLLAITAIQARDSARDERREAEGLVAFMLGDLKDKLEPIGRLDALDGVGSRVLAYYRDQDAAELSDAGLVQRSQALSLSAQVAYLRGDFAAAQKLYREAIEGTEEAIRREPNDPQRLYEHAQNVFYFGHIAADRGDLGRAEAAFRDYRSLAARMTALQPDNLKWKMEAQYADANLGVVLLRQRRFESSVRQFSEALKTIEAVAAVEPDNAEYQTSVADSLAWLSDAQLARGDLKAATESRTRQVRLLEALAAKSGDVLFQEKLIPAVQSLGRLLAVAGRAPEAQAQFDHAVAIAERLLPSEPTNSRWIEFAAKGHFVLAQHVGTTRGVRAAESNVDAGCDYAGRLKGTGGSASWQLVHWSCVDQRAQLSLATGQPGSALRYANQSFSLAQGLKSGDPQADRSLVAKSLLLSGDAFQANRRPAEARASWSRALKLTDTRLGPPWERVVRAQLLDRLGQRAAAREIERDLKARGFRNFAMLKT